MRVLLISHTCVSPTEGQPRVRFLKAIPGIELRVVVPDRWRSYGVWTLPQIAPDLAGVISVTPVRWPWAGPAQWYLHYYPSLRQVVEEFKPDIIDVWEEPWGLVSAQVCRVRRRVAPRARIVQETEQNILKKLPPPFEQLRRFTLQRIDFLVGRSKEAVRVAHATGYAGRSEVVPNAVDTELFRPLDRGACRSAMNLSGFVVGYVGCIFEGKGLSDLLEAVARCPNDVSTVIVGTGPMEAELIALATKLNISDRVQLLPARPFQELPLIMNAIDVLVLPSRTTPRWKEQFGRVLIEAQACGTPVIGSSSGAIPDVVGKAGIVFAERDPTALADAILKLRASKELRDSFGAAGLANSVESCSWKVVADRMYEIYKRII